MRPFEPVQPVQVEPMTEHERAEFEGWDAALGWVVDGADPNDYPACPYPEGTSLAEAWDRGFTDGESK